MVVCRRIGGGNNMALNLFTCPNEDCLTLKQVLCGDLTWRIIEEHEKKCKNPEFLF